MRILGFCALVMLLLSACVSKKTLLAEQEAAADLRSKLDIRNQEMRECSNLTAEQEQEIRNLKNQLAIANTQAQTELGNAERLQEEIDFLKRTNENLLGQLSNLSVISQAGAESINKSLEAISKQSTYIEKLTEEMQYKDSVNLALVMNLKRSLSDMNDQDVQIEVKKGVVYISLSDKLLFSSGSTSINPAASTVLGKIATVINDHQELEVLVEGHTDDVPISRECYSDNWDLSVQRAVEIVRTLQDTYNVDPARMTAGGRSEFVPKSSNATSEGRSANRRTEIIILPKLDEFFKLLEAPAPGN